MPNAQPPLSQRVQQLKLIHISFVASIFIYALVLVVQTREPGAPTDISALRPILTVVAALTAAASIWWRRRTTGQTHFMPIQDPSATDSFEQLQTNCIITWALSEAVAVIGLILGLMSRDIGTLLPFAAAGLALLVVHRPSVWPQWPGN